MPHESSNSEVLTVPWFEHFFCCRLKTEEMILFSDTIFLKSLCPVTQYFVSYTQSQIFVISCGFCQCVVLLSCPNKICTIVIFLYYYIYVELLKKVCVTESSVSPSRTKL